MINMILTGLLVLACELGGVGIITGLFYLYDKHTCKN